MALVRLHKKGQMTLPQDVRQELGLEEGDLLAVEVEEGVVVLRPQRLIDASQAYFWSEAWQAEERQASADIGERRTVRFPDADGAVDYLRAEAARRRES